MRIGIIEGGRIIEERLIRVHRGISIGQGPRNSFVISSANLPSTYKVFDATPDSYILKFAEGMDGRVTVDGHVRTLTQIREAGIAKKAGDWWQLPLDKQARGKLVIGEVTLLFQQVQAPPVTPRARLPATIRGSVGSRMDPPFTMTMAGAFVLAAILFITVQVVPKPSGPTKSKRLRQLVNSEMKRSHPKPMKPPPPPMVAETDTGKDDGKGDGDGKKAVSSKPAGGGRGDKSSGKASGPLRKGTSDYNKRLSELTTFSLNTGSNKMKSVAIAGKCTSEEDCKNAISGQDHLRGGIGAGDLDDRARNTAGSGGQGVHGSGPSSGSGGKRGIVGRGRGGLGVKGTGTGSGTAAPMAMRMMAPPMIKGRVSSFVPPPMVSGSAGARVRSKIRARVYGLRSCYNRALISNPKLSGSVKISFIIMPNGRVSSVNVRSGMGGSIISCIQGKVSRWHLGKVPSQVFFGPFTVRFTPGG